MNVLGAVVLLVLARTTEGQGVFKRILAEALKIYAPTSHVFNNEKCRKHAEFYKKSVYKNADWALRMLDAGSKLPPAGLLSGNVLDLGHYEQCVEVEDVASPEGVFSGQHCLVTVGRESWGTQLSMQRRRELHPDEARRDVQPPPPKTLDERLSRLGFVGAVCVPSSCRARDVEQHLREQLRRLLRVNVSVSVTEKACSSRADLVPPTGGTTRLILAAGVIYGSIIVLGTLYDLCNFEPGMPGDILRAFSLRCSLRKLVRPYSPGSEALPVLDGLRVVGWFMMVLFHRMFLSYSAPAISLYKDTATPFTWLGLFIWHSNYGMDNLFAISGLLTAYIFFGLLNKGHTINLLAFYLHRFVRVTPMIILLVLGTLIDIQDPTKSAPLLKANMGLGRENCENNWFYTVFYLVNYIPAKDMCVPPTWNLAVDMHCYLVSPVFLYALYKRPRLGRLLVAVFLVFGVLLSFRAVYVNVLNILANNTVGLKHEAVFYPTHLRYTPWLVGVAFGSYLHLTGNAPLPLSRPALYFGHLLAVGVVWVSTYLREYFWDDVHPLSTALFLSLHRPLCACACLWVVLVCVKGHGGYINKVLSWPGFLILSRISFPIMFVHLGVMGASFVLMKTIPDNSNMYITAMFLSDLLITVLTAVPVHLCVEAPLINLETLLLRRGIAKKKTKTEKLEKGD